MEAESASMISMVRRATIVVSPTVTANWLMCSSHGSWQGGCKASPRGERGVFSAWLFSTTDEESGLKKSLKICCAEMKWFEARVTDSSLQEENTSCMWNQET